jgi:hypothetical protein
LKKTDNKSPPVGIKFEQDVYTRLDTISKMEGVSLASVARRMVDLGFRAMDEKAGRV